MKKLIILTVIAAFAASSAAFAAPKVSIVGAATYPLMKAISTGDPATAAVEVKPTFGYGGGLLLELPMSATVGFEFGGIFAMNRTKTTITISNVATSTTVSSKNLVIPGVFRFALGKVVSLGVGGYYSLSLETGGGNDYGVSGGPRFNLGPKFFIDGRYMMTMKSVPAGAEKFQQILGLVGFQFGGK